MKRVCVVSLFLALTACGTPEGVEQINELSERLEQTPTQEPQSITDTIKTLDQNLATAGNITKAQNITFKTTQFEYSLPKKIKDFCSDWQKNVGNKQQTCAKVEVLLATTNPDFIAQHLNHYITTDDNPQKTKFTRHLDETLFLHMQIDDAAQNTSAKKAQTDVSAQDLQAQSPQVSAADTSENINSATYSISAYPEKMQGYQHIAQFLVRKNDRFDAQNMTQTAHFVFDLNLQSRVYLTDILAPDITVNDIIPFAKQNLEQLLQNTYELPKENVIDILDKNYFFISNDFYFNEAGLVLFYNADTILPKQIDDKLLGDISITVDYKTLIDHKLLRPEYLVQAPKYETDTKKDNIETHNN